MNSKTYSTQNSGNSVGHGMLRWEIISCVDRGVLSPFEKLNRARFGHGWLVKYEYYGGSLKSGSALTYVEDPEELWKKEASKLKSKIINKQSNPNQFMVIRCFEASPGNFLAMVGGTKECFWSQLLFVPVPK